MQYIKDPCRQIEELEKNVKELEKELELKDQMHLQDLSFLRGQLETLMTKYCLK